MPYRFIKLGFFFAHTKSTPLMVAAGVGTRSPGEDAGTQSEVLEAVQAKIAIWNQKNKQDWTPLRIAEGVHRTGNLRASATTAAALRKIMGAAGVTTEVEPEAIISGSTK